MRIGVWHGVAWVVFGMCVWACDEPVKNEADTAQTVDGSEEDGVEPQSTEVVFELNATLEGKEGFFDFPYPSDLRLNAEGGPVLGTLGNPKSLPLLGGLLDAASKHPGFPVLPVAWFQLTGPVAERSEADAIAPSIDSPIFLVKLSDGTLYPTVAQTLAGDIYTPDNVLGVAPFPGIVLEPKETFAFVLMRSLGDAEGAPLGVSEDFAALVRGETPEGALGADAATLYAELWPVLDDLGIAAEDVASATVFTTGDVVQELFDLSEVVRADYQPRIENLSLEKTWPRLCQVHGELTVPEFQVGDPPFDVDGLFEFDDAGKPIQQRDTTIPVVITIPRVEMPEAGYPLVMYFHGSGGISTQLVDRGPVTSAGGSNTPGEGPAYVVAEHGFAMAGSAHPVNPERLPGASAIAYLNLLNPKALRDTFRQGTIEQRLYLDALLALEIEPGLLTGCDGATLPAGASVFRLDPEPILAMGQSMGGMYTNMIGAVEPRIQAVVPTGAGGFWSHFIVLTSLIDAKSALELILGARDLTFLHPTLHVAETVFGPAEPMVYMPRLAARPLEGHPARHIFEPVGRNDEYFPMELYDAIALAYGHPQAGDEIWPSMQEVLALEGLDGYLEYPVANNLTSTTGEAYTGIVVQYDQDAFQNGHYIYVQREEVRFQYGCFLKNFYETGVGTVPAPASLGSPCR